MVSKEAKKTGVFRGYSMQDPLSATAVRAQADPQTYAHMRLAKRGEAREYHRAVVRQVSGRRLADFIWVSLEPLIHDRVVSLLTDLKITGWSTYPVEVRDARGEIVYGYSGLAVTGRCQSMFLDRDHSELVYVPYPKGLGPKYRGLCISEATWDGSDLFTAADRASDFTVVTERVRAAFSEERITNVSFLPISQVEVDASDQPIIS